MVSVNNVLDEMVPGIWKGIQIFDQRSRRVVKDFFFVSEGDAFYLCEGSLPFHVFNEFKESLLALSSYNNIDFGIGF